MGTKFHQTWLFHLFECLSVFSRHSLVKRLLSQKKERGRRIIDIIDAEGRLLLLPFSMGESVSWSLGTERGDDDFVTLNLGSATVRACVCVFACVCVPLRGRDND